MSESKQTRYRLKMQATGFREILAWVPSDQCDLFRAVAAALREGVPVTIGKVTSDPKTEKVTKDSETEKVASDPETEKVAKDPEAKPKKPRKDYQAIWRAQFEEASESVSLRTGKGELRQAKIIGRYQCPERSHRFGSGTGPMVQILELIVEFQSRTHGRRFYAETARESFAGRHAWRFENRTESAFADARYYYTLPTDKAELHRAIADAHPDTGSNPDPERLQQLVEHRRMLRKQEKTLG